MFEAMNHAIEGAGIVPHVDEKVFGIEEAKEYVLSPPPNLFLFVLLFQDGKERVLTCNRAYEYMWAQKHIGKVVVNLD